jgi:MFS family permease
MQTKTNFRWTIIAILFSLNFLSYIDRSALSYAVPELMQELSLNHYQMGLILGSFGIGYFIATLLGGIFVDEWGPRKILLGFTLIWAISIASMGMAAGFLSAYLSRLGLGVGEGPNFPAVARAVSDWLPLKSRASALSNSLVAVPISLAIGAPLITALLTIIGWRSMFVILGLVILCWWPLCYFLFANKPHESPFVNQAEKEFINQDEQISHSKKKIDKYYFFKNKTLLSNGWGFFVYGYSMFFYLTWLPDFLQSVYHLNIKQIGLFSVLPWLLAAIFLWIMGYTSDFIYQKTHSLRYARSYPIFIGQLLTLICLIPVVISNNLSISLLSISLAIAFNLSNNTTFYSTNIDVAKEKSATSLGIMNAGFAIAGFLAPTLTGALVESTGSFHSAFVLMVLLTLSAVIVTFFFHHPKPI